ncbi:MAG: ribosome biogenesis GTP-binding protein YihA/YsxC [Pseudomonadales bacterium]|nr:ribosome biogenesis GTP-binding protein YihA/YsxC [Pseudomonadales bacterium]
MNQPEKNRAKQIEAVFLISAASPGQYPAENGYEIAFAGRSNAGKSSVLNRLTGNRQLARTSKTPGRTQLINFFDVTGGGRLVDLPGYGYAKASQKQKLNWRKNNEHYLSQRDSLAGLILVMDIRHPFQPYDLEMIDWALDSRLPLHMLLNKCDKLKQGVRTNTLREATQKISETNLLTVQLFSAKSGIGLDQARDQINKWRT